MASVNTVDRSEDSTALRVAFIGGGSGGHLFPAIAIARELLNAQADCRFLFLTSDRQVDRQVLDNSCLPDAATQITPYASMSSRHGVFRSVLRLRSLWLSLRKARRHLKSFQPDIVVGLGALASVPGVIAASRMTLPIVLLEQNSQPGKATRVLARRAKLTLFGLQCADTILQTWPSPFRINGTQVRAEIQKPVTEILASKRILIIGGSQGAHAVNQIVMRAFADGLQIPSDWEIAHQTGHADVAIVREFYQRHGIMARVEAFLTDMPAELSTAAIAISRAGAVSIQELACAGLPSILLPLSTSANDHQMHNARLLEQAGAAIVIEERQRNADHMTRSALKKLLGNADERQSLSNRIRTFASPNATVETVRLLGVLARENC